MSLCCCALNVPRLTGKPTVLVWISGKWSSGLGTWTLLPSVVKIAPGTLWGSFFSVSDLIAAIEEFLEAWNENPRPFVWTATVESIVAKFSGCRQTLEQIQPGCTLPRQRKQPRLSS